MSQYIVALLDANVLYPASIRDILVQLANDDLFQAKWTADIHREWIEALLRNEPDLQRHKLEGTRELMDSKTRDALVTGYESLIDTLKLPDPDDRHVLAAAIVGHCGVIVTEDLKHFPQEALDPYGIEVQRSDDFLAHHLNLFPVRVCKSIRKVRLRLNSPSYTVEEYLANLTQLGLTRTVSKLERFSQFLA